MGQVDGGQLTNVLEDEGAVEEEEVVQVCTAREQVSRPRAVAQARVLGSHHTELRRSPAGPGGSQGLKGGLRVMPKAALAAALKAEPMSMRGMGVAASPRAALSRVTCKAAGERARATGAARRAEGWGPGMRRKVPGARGGGRQAGAQQQAAGVAARGSSRWTPARRRRRRRPSRAWPWCSRWRPVRRRGALRAARCRWTRSCRTAGQPGWVSARGRPHQRRGCARATSSGATDGGAGSDCGEGGAHLALKVFQLERKVLQRARRA